VKSLIINLLGHCNYDFFSQHAPEHLLKFSYRHSMHHKKGKGNLGFLLPWLDKIFNTAVKNIS
jgi:lathosterol oxidase